MRVLDWLLRRHYEYMTITVKRKGVVISQRVLKKRVYSHNRCVSLVRQRYPSCSSSRPLSPESFSNLSLVAPNIQGDYLCSLLIHDLYGLDNIFCLDTPN